MIVDLFEHIKVMAMTEAEKIELMDEGPKYLEMLSKDESMAVRIRAKMRISDEDMEKAKQQRLGNDIAQLQEEAKSKDFKTRIRAKALLTKIREMEAYDQ